MPSAALCIDNSSIYLREGLEHRTYSECSWRGREAGDFVEPALEETLYFSEYITSATPPFVRELTQVLSPRRGFCFSVGRAAILTSWWAQLLFSQAWFCHIAPPLTAVAPGTIFRVVLIFFPFVERFNCPFLTWRYASERALRSRAVLV